MTQLWTFVAADGELAARELALRVATRDRNTTHVTTHEAVEFEPGRWRVRIALHREPAA